MKGEIRRTPANALPAPARISSSPAICRAKRLGSSDSGAVLHHCRSSYSIVPSSELCCYHELTAVLSGSSSAVERQLPKLDVTGSIPVSRSKHSGAAKLLSIHFGRLPGATGRTTFASVLHGIPNPLRVGEHVWPHKER